MKALVPKVMHVFPGLRPGGGPAGYAFHLQQALGIVEGVDRLIEIVVPAGVRLKVDNPQAEPSWRFRLLKKMPRWLAGAVLGVHTAYTVRNALRYFGFGDDQIDKLRRAQVVVFHDYRLAFSYVHAYRTRPEQQVLLMPHSPTDLTSELIENWRGVLGDSPIWKLLHKTLVRLELETFLRAAGVITPCRNALEGYFLGLPCSQTFLSTIPVYEVKTGVRGLNATQTSSEVRKRWGVAPGEKVVGYFGRRHPHKGFDLFVRVAELAYERGWRGVRFVSAGKGHLPSPRHLPNYLDLGYLTNQLADAVAAVDLVVVPNRVSYFDLFILEAMSLGKVVLTSRVGGNVCFDAPGILFVEELTAESFLQNIEKLLSQDELREFMGRENQRYFEQEYDLLSFAKRHLLLAQTLLGG